jgi:DNA repair exonuclease SbcCD ATPase subunit
MRQLMLSEKLQPFLEDADRALSENMRLRELVGQLQHKLRHSEQMQDAAADKIDLLEEELGVAHREVTLLKARMKIFGEAANAIITESSKEAKEAYIPKPREEFKPTPEQPARPVRPLLDELSDELTPSLAFLARIDS